MHAEFAPLMRGMMAAASLAMLAGCMQKELKAAYSAPDHAAWMGKGTATVNGEGFIRRPNGWLARCSGERVYLIPASSYFREWIDIRRSGASVANSRALFETHKEALRTVQCDQRGRFQFAELPPGKWFVLTRISYESARDSFSENALYVTETETKPGQSASVILSNPNRI